MQLITGIYTVKRCPSIIFDLECSCENPVIQITAMLLSLFCLLLTFLRRRVVRNAIRATSVFLIFVCIIRLYRFPPQVLRHIKPCQGAVFPRRRCRVARSHRPHSKIAHRRRSQTRCGTEAVAIGVFDIDSSYSSASSSYSSSSFALFFLFIPHPHLLLPSLNL